MENDEEKMEEEKMENYKPEPVEIKNGYTVPTRSPDSEKYWDFEKNLPKRD